MRIGWMILFLTFWGWAEEIRLEPKSVNWQTVTNLELCTQTIQVKYTGEGEAKLKTIRTSCGCLRAEIGQNRLGKGATRHSVTRQNPANFSLHLDPWDERGIVRKKAFVQIELPDGKLKTLTVFIVLQVKRILEMTPKKIQFSPDVKAQRIAFKITNPKLTDLKLSDPTGKLAISAISSENGVFVYELTLLEPLTEVGEKDVASGQLLLKGNYDGKPIERQMPWHYLQN